MRFLVDGAISGALLPVDVFDGFRRAMIFVDLKSDRLKSLDWAELLGMSALNIYN